jgi:GTPase
MDRSELILDIFASRARTREAKLQVELAQLQYLLPRLARMWTHLSRIRGGIGLRGPGETQLETDRRLIGRRIADLRVKLQDVAEARATRRKRRRGEYRVALVGYTNAGKSSILKALTGADVLVEDRLFATLDSATRSVELGQGYECLLTDTVGFIRKLPHHLVASFRSTLEEAREADLLLHVIDASHPDWEEQKEVVEEVLSDLELDGSPQLLVFNKTDRLTHGEEEALRARIVAFDPTPSVFVSAVEEGGLQSLVDALRARVRARYPRVELDLPPEEGEWLAAVHREGEVLEVKAENGRLEVSARIPQPLLGRLRKVEGSGRPGALTPAAPQGRTGGAQVGGAFPPSSIFSPAGATLSPMERFVIIGPGRLGLALGTALAEIGRGGFPPVPRAAPRSAGPPPLQRGEGRVPLRTGASASGDLGRPPHRTR